MNSKELECSDFRRALAGFGERSETEVSEDDKDLAISVAVFLAKHFCRDKLDPYSLWTRIESALKLGVNKQTDDPVEMIDAMLLHVLADARNVCVDPEYIEIIEKADSKWIKSFRVYVNTRIFHLLTMARKKWKLDSAKRIGRATPMDEAMARWSGKKATSIWPEADVEECLQEIRLMNPNDKDATNENN